MITAYYSRGCNSKKMFENLEIAQSDTFQKHLNQYDVIHLDIQWCLEPAGSVENVVPFIIKSTLKELREIYPNEVPEEVNSLADALSRIKMVTGKKFIIVIDEWDVFCLLYTSSSFLKSTLYIYNGKNTCCIIF